MYDTFVIFYTANYCQNIKAYFEVDKLIASGIRVEFWDLSDITVNESLTPVHSKGLKEVRISTISELEQNIKRVNELRCLFLSFVNFAPYSLRVYRMLSKHKCDILYATSGVLPSRPNDSSRIQRIFAKYKLKTIFKILLLKLASKIQHFVAAKYVLMSCNKAVCDYKVSSDTIYLSCNSGDYNRYLSDGKGEIKNQIVFIDQYTPFHNDYTLKGWRHISPEKYYKALNAFFSNIEKRYNCEVVICAHPSALKYKEKDYFEGRRIFYNDISRQVSQSLGVIAQFSTAISFPVMDNKPIILITTDEMNELHPHFASFESYLAEILNVPMVNIDEISYFEFKDIDTKAYNDYFMNYLTTPKMKGCSNADVLIAIAKGNYKQFIY